MSKFTHVLEMHNYAGKGGEKTKQADKNTHKHVSLTQLVLTALNTQEDGVMLGHVITTKAVLIQILHFIKKKVVLFLI